MRTTQPPLSPHPVVDPPARRAAPKASRRSSRAAPAFSEAHRRAASDELGLHAFCTHAECQRHGACWGAGADIAAYPCWTAVAAWARGGGKVESDQSIEEMAEDYMDRLKLLIKSLGAGEDESTGDAPSHPFDAALSRDEKAGDARLDAAASRPAASPARPDPGPRVRSL